MPNTLCHIGVQAPLNGLILHKRDLIWVIIACVIPDIPWITLKLLLASQTIDPYEARLYCTAQASLLFCLILSAALALLSRESMKTFLILGANCFFHLGLDAMQIKWGNGVHFIAPLSWEMFHLDLFWPGFPGVILMTGGGFLFLLLRWKAIAGQGILFSRNIVKVMLALALVTAYLAGPLYFKQQLEEADTYYIATMRNVEKRAGKTIELDRARYLADTREARVYTGETIKLTGTVPAESGRVSFKGVFVDAQTIACSAYHRSGNYRDYASLAGLFMACALLIQSLILSKFKSHKPQ